MQATKIILLAAVLASVAAYGTGRWQGYNSGEAAAEARTEAVRLEAQNALFKAGEKLSRLSVDLERQKRDQTQQSKAYENAAQNDTDVCLAVSDRSLQRVHGRWGAPRSIARRGQ